MGSTQEEHLVAHHATLTQETDFEKV